MTTEQREGWWTRNATVISGLSNIATALAAVGVAITLLVSVSQLNLAREQLESTALSLQASTAFLLSQEGRDVALLLHEDLDRYQGFGFSFFHTAWYQKRIGALDDELWIPIDAEICAFVADVDADAFFSAERSKMYHRDFVAYIKEKGSEECRSQ